MTDQYSVFRKTDTHTQKTKQKLKPKPHITLPSLTTVNTQTSEAHLVPRGVLPFALLGNVEAEVLQQDDGSRGGVSTGSFHLRAHTVLQEGDVPTVTELVSVIMIGS